MCWAPDASKLETQTSTPFLESLRPQILPPRPTEDVRLDRALSGMQSQRSEAPESHRAKISRLQAVSIHHFPACVGLAHLCSVEGPFGRYAPNSTKRRMWSESRKRGRSMRRVVEPDTLENRRSVVHHMAHHVELRVVPRDDIAVVPDPLCAFGKFDWPFPCPPLLITRTCAREAHLLWFLGCGHAPPVGGARNSAHHNAPLRSTSLQRLRIGSRREPHAWPFGWPLRSPGGRST